MGQFRSFKCINFFGIKVIPHTIEEIAEFVLEHCKEQQRISICHVNIHSLYLFHLTYIMKHAFMRAKLVYFDGMIPLYLCRVAGIPLNKNQRARCIDLMPSVLAVLENTYCRRVFILGSSEKTNANAVDKIQREFPSLQVLGHNGYFDLNNMDKVLAKINEFRPNLIVVGMGMPRQEKFFVQAEERLPKAVCLMVGAWIEQYTGQSYNPPQWAGPLGVEWLFRFLLEPTRLFKRYFIEPIVLICYLMVHPKHAKIRPL